VREVIEPRAKRNSTSVNASAAVDHFQLSAELACVDVAGVGLMIGSPLVVEIAQDRSGASTAFRR
jgi:hypothetical protein